jgi:hypothetical protein
MLFTGKLNAVEAGNALGDLVYWILHFTAIAMLLKYGAKWTSKRRVRKKHVKDPEI